MVRRKEFLWYCVVGTLSTVIYFFTRFTSKALINHVLVSVLIGQTFAIISSFLGNKFIVFRQLNVGFVKSLKQFGEFCMGRLVVLLLDLGIAYFFVDKYQKVMIGLLHLQRFNYHNWLFSHPMFSRYIGNEYLLNEFIFTVTSQILATIINYVFSKKVVFNIQKSQEISII